ncbi:MAG: M48 family metallopeptidase [Pontibacterium sp.]
MKSKLKHCIKPILAITLISVLAGCQALQEVDKGLYSVANSVGERDRVTGRYSLSFAGRASQIKTGNAYVERILQEERKAGKPVDAAVDKKMYQRLTRIFHRVHAVSHLREEQWQVVLLKRDSFNAFTTGGTYVVVHSELMNQLSNDDELAAVIGHEIAHVTANHVFERQAHAQVSAVAGSTASRTSLYQAAFTHESEIEADQIGILYSALAGYDPMAASRIWERQFKKQGNARALFAHDHPVNAERAAQTKRIGQKVLPYYRAGQQNPEYAQLLDNNVLWQSQQLSKAGEGGGAQALFGAILGGYAQHQKTKIEARRQQQKAALVTAIQERLELIKSTKHQNTHLRTQWRYREGPTLDSLVLGVMVQDNQQVKRAVAHIKGPVRAGARFNADIPLPEGVNIKHVNSKNTRLYLDDVELLR